MKYWTISGWSRPCAWMNASRVAGFCDAPSPSAAETGSPGTRLVSANVTIVTPTSRSTEVPTRRSRYPISGDLRRCACLCTATVVMSTSACGGDLGDVHLPHGVVHRAGDVIRRGDVATGHDQRDERTFGLHRLGEGREVVGAGCGIRCAGGVCGDAGDRRIGLGCPARAQTDLESRSEGEEVRRVGVVRTPEPQTEALGAGDVGVELSGEGLRGEFDIDAGILELRLDALGERRELHTTHRVVIRELQLQGLTGVTGSGERRLRLGLIGLHTGAESTLESGRDHAGRLHGTGTGELEQGVVIERVANRLGDLHVREVAGDGRRLVQQQEDRLTGRNGLD